HAAPPYGLARQVDDAPDDQQRADHDNQHGSLPWNDDQNYVGRGRPPRMTGSAFIPVGSAAKSVSLQKRPEVKKSNRRVWWGDFPATAFARIDAEATIAVLPIAAIEQHGPHLPVSTDTTIMQGMLDTVIAALPAELDIRILPIQAVGKS